MCVESGGWIDERIIEKGHMTMEGFIYIECSASLSYHLDREPDPLIFGVRVTVRVIDPQVEVWRLRLHGPGGLPQQLPLLFLTKGECLVKIQDR